MLFCGYPPWITPPTAGTGAGRYTKNEDALAHTAETACGQARGTTIRRSRVLLEGEAQTDGSIDFGGNHHIVVRK